PRLREAQAVAARDVEARAAGEAGADLEARGVDDAVDVVFLAGDDETLLGDALDTLAVGVDQRGARVVERVEVFVMEARALGELAVPGLQLLAGALVVDDGRGAVADFLHLFEIGIFPRGPHRLRRPLLHRDGHDAFADAARQVRPAVLHPVLCGLSAGLVGGEVLEPARLPAG